MHNPGLGLPLQTFRENPFEGSSVRVTVNVTYGDLDVYDTFPRCILVGVDPQECVVDGSLWTNSSASPADRPRRVVYREYVSANVRQLELIGTFANVTRALDVLLYKPLPQQNSIRLKSRVYSPASAEEQPYERMYIGVDFLQSGDSMAANAKWQRVGDMDQLVYTVNINDQPSIVEPKESYVYPPFCSMRNPNPVCHFGQFFAYEDTGIPVDVAGVEIADVDLYEDCGFIQQECKQVDVGVSTLRGAIGLNTRNSLTLYEEGRSVQGFTSILSAANKAVSVLFYRVEQPALLGPTSITNNFNTQHSNNAEGIIVTVSDQGFSGAAGVSQVNTIFIPVQIVAVNDPPLIDVQFREFSFIEDTPVTVNGISVSDVDVDEEITSTLSQSTWTNLAANLKYLNKMRATVYVNFGTLRMLYSRNLRIVRTNEVQFTSIEAFRFGHDLCRARDTFLQNLLVSQAAQALGRDFISYQDVCVFANAGSSLCPTSAEAGCACLFDDDCLLSDPNIVLYFNVSRPFDQFRTLLTKALDDQDKTCGGLPVYPL